MESWLYCNRKWQLWLLVAVFTFCSVNAEDDLQCSPGITTPGVTIPSGDITLIEGSPLEILCMLSKKSLQQGFNANNLVFYHTKYRVDNKFVKVVNESVAQLYIEKPPLMKDMFYCKLTNGTQETPVCLNSVAVGHPPADVLNFTCVSYNWESLNCTWTPPPNFVKTKYTLYYYLPGRAGAKMKFLCPNETDAKGLNYCYWHVDSLAPYRRPYEFYYFNMTGENPFGKRSYKSTFHNYAHVIPAKAANLILLEKTHDRIVIQWSLVTAMMNFPPGLQQKVEYKSQWDPIDYWKTVNTSSLDIKSATHTLNISGLEYANCLYDIRVFMKSPYAIGGNFWSQPASLTVRTKPTAPVAPKADTGSFELISSLNGRDVNIYWQKVPESLHNGENFSYRVDIEVYEKGVFKHVKSVVVTDAFAEIKNISMNKYKFKIYSVNQEDSSKEYAEVIVPSDHNRVKEPSRFSKIAFDNHIYELSWEHHSDPTNPITSYTIFWCENSKETRYQCTGTLNWMQVSKDTLATNITVPDDKIYQFAISANTETDHSGMVWAECTVIHDRFKGKMKNVWINRIQPTSMDIGWNLECSDRIKKVTAFLISYCPIIAPDNTSCKKKAEIRRMEIHGNRSMKQGTLEDLKPYTTYKVNVAVEISNNTVGQWSDSRFNTTLETAPDTPPYNVKITNITNTSMVVEWVCPELLNGGLRRYEIFYNGAMKELINNKLGSNEIVDPKIELTGLESYTSYNVSVRACTVACSAMSAPVSETTRRGSPSEISNFHVILINTTHANMTWSIPAHPGGPANSIYYLIRKTINNNEEQYFNITGNTEYTLPVCSSGEDSDDKYSVSIRAINFFEGIELASPWTTPVDGPCFKDYHWILLALIFLGVFTVAVSVAFVCRGKQIFEKLKNMFKVEIDLPSGLKPAEIPINMDFGTSFHSRGPTTNKENEEKSSPDEVRLLHDKSHLDQDVDDKKSLSSNGSSGCSSGHNSVSSSLAPSSQMSSDSGTEADQYESEKLPSRDDVFTSSLIAPGSSELRLRYGRSNKENGSSSSICTSKSNPILSELADIPAYSKASIDVNCRPIPAAGGYVSLPITGSMMPFKELPSPAKGYVMAGEAQASQYCRLDQLPRSN